MAEKDKDKEIQKELENMSLYDMGFKLLEIIAQNRPNEYEMLAIINFALNLFSQLSKPDPDEPAS